MQSREEIRKFLNFYKRKNSVCVDLYQPAFYSKKPNWEDLAEFVYAVLSVGSTSAPGLIRAAVKDVQLHPVKKLLFFKFSDQVIRDEVAARLQAGLVWPAFDTTVTGWAMDKPVERIRLLGASPETDEAGVRLVLGKYGEVLDAKKGLISPKKLPGCSNGIWTVKMILGEDQTLPPFLIMKEEGEVWQLTTGEISVCWKCGCQGHIGDKCYQDVSALAASLVSPSVSQQPSWAHVVRGVRAGTQHHQFPPPPPYPQFPPPAQKLCVPITAEVIVVAKNRLSQVGERMVGGVFDGVHPAIRDEFVREQQNKAAAQHVEAAHHVEVADNSDQQVEPADKSAQPVEDARETNVVAAADIFVAGEIITFADQSKSHESHVLVQPADAVYCEVGHQDGQEIEGSDDTLFESEKSESLSMKVQISDNMNEGGLVSSGSGSAVEEGDTSVKNKKFKQSENVASGNSENQTSSPELPHKLPARSRQEVITSDEGSEETMEGVHCAHQHVWG